MNGSAELVQLAELLRLGVRTGRQIATLRPGDAEAIERLAVQAEGIADALVAMVASTDVVPGADQAH